MRVSVAALGIAALFAQSPSSSIEGIYFLGQTYPSGSVYLLPFSDETRSRETTPGTISFVTLPADKSVFDSRPQEATLSSQTLSSDYIPAIEGMDEEHRRCGEGQIRKREPGFRYSSADFFETLFDWCNSTDGVRRYRSVASSQTSVMVFAFSGVRITRVTPVSGARPLTAEERREVAEDKAELANVSECTTESVFLDSAERILEVTAEDGLTLRLSSYKTPGCLGHLTTIYILDFLRGEGVVRTLQLHQDQGLL